MRTLYVSDLDGTLLNRADRLSAYSCAALNTLIRGGMLFTYATARSLDSAAKVTAGLRLRAPVIVYNGAFIRDPSTGGVLRRASFPPGAAERAARFLLAREIYPLVYSFVDGMERVSWLVGRESAGMLHYLRSRAGDRRLRPVRDVRRLYAGDVFYLTCIGTQGALQPVAARFADDGDFVRTFQQELYREEYWCELMPAQATKAHAVQALRGMLGCGRTVVFGDAVNDLPMFEAADDCYAPCGAAPAVRARALGILPSNEEDGVARFLARHFRP